MAFTVGRFQPGTFLWGRVHGEALSKITTDGKYLPSTPDCRRGCIRVTAEGSFRRALAFGKGSFILDIACQRAYEILSQGSSTCPPRLKKRLSVTSGNRCPGLAETSSAPSPNTCNPPLSRFRRVRT